MVHLGEFDEEGGLIACPAPSRKAEGARPARAPLSASRIFRPVQRDQKAHQGPAEPCVEGGGALDVLRDQPRLPAEARAGGVPWPHPRSGVLATNAVRRVLGHQGGDGALEVFQAVEKITVIVWPMPNLDELRWFELLDGSARGRVVMAGTVGAAMTGALRALVRYSIEDA